MGGKTKESVGEEMERLLGADPRLFVTDSTLRYVRERFHSINQGVRDLTRQKGEAALETDGWHSEAFREAEQEVSTLAAVRRSLEPLGNVDYFLQKARPITPNKEEKVGLGSKVKVKVSVGGNGDRAREETYILVGPLDVTYSPDKTPGWVSCLAPIGTGLLGKTKGESFKVVAPEGTSVYEIIEISPADELQGEEVGEPSRK